MSTSADPDVTVTMPLSAWRIVADSNPSDRETYTPEGIRIFDAWQPILQAVAPSADQQ